MGSQDQCLGTWGLCPVKGMQLLLSLLQAQLVAKLSMYPRDTQTCIETGWSHRLPQARAAFNKTYTQVSHRHRHRQPRHLSPLWQVEILKAHTQHSPGSQAHTHSRIFQAPGMAPLSGGQHLAPPAASTKHKCCDLWPRSSHWWGAPHSPHSSGPFPSTQEHMLVLPQWLGAEDPTASSS